VARENIHVEGSLLRAGPGAQNHQGLVAEALDVDGGKDYSASLTNNPTQLLIDLYGNSGTAAMRTAKAKRGDQTDDERANEGSTAGPNSSGRSVQNVAAKDSSGGPLSPAPAAISNSAIAGSVGGGAPPAGNNAGST